MEAKERTALAHYGLPAMNAVAFAGQLLPNFGQALQLVSSAAGDGFAAGKQVAAAVAFASLARLAFRVVESVELTAWLAGKQTAGEVV